MRNTCQKASMLSQEGETLPVLYLIIHGCTGTPARNAPDLNGSSSFPLVVVPCRLHQRQIPLPSIPNPQQTAVVDTFLTSGKSNTGRRASPLATLSIRSLTCAPAPCIGHKIPHEHIQWSTDGAQAHNLKARILCSCKLAAYPDFALANLEVSINKYTLQMLTAWATFSSEPLGWPSYGWLQRMVQQTYIWKAAE